MNRLAAVFAGGGLVVSAAAYTQTTTADGALAGRSPVAAAPPIILPMDTIVQVTAVQEITSIKMKEGDIEMLQIAADVSERGVVVIPRGSPVMAKVTWRTGKGIVGKSAKFEVTFDSVTVHGTKYAMKGKYRAEGRGNTVGALLGSMIITGKSATIVPGQVINAFTAEPIPAV